MDNIIYKELMEIKTEIQDLNILMVERVAPLEVCMRGVKWIGTVTVAFVLSVCGYLLRINLL